MNGSTKMGLLPVASLPSCMNESTEMGTNQSLAEFSRRKRTQDQKILGCGPLADMIGRG